MHPRNKYCKNPADFGKLGEKYPEIRKYLLPTSNGYTINFKDPKALRELTVSLVHHDFGLKVELPLDRLIPTVTLRLNYIHWIEDLLQMLPGGDTGQTTGIDIGTGASCIYPLLGAKINGWKFCASEVDEISYRFACENVKRNDLEESIQVRLVTPDIVLADLLKEGEHYDFTMCNPPFFADKSERVGNHSRTGDRPRPSSVCTGSESETVTSGGEVAFVGRMIDDSLRLGSNVEWYTTMLGKKSSLTSVVTKLKHNNISNIVTTEFCQGRTMRWGVAWTFSSEVVTKCTPKKKRKNKPLQFTFSSSSVCPKETLSEVQNIEQIISRISERFKEILNDLQIQVLSENIANEEEAKRTKLHCSATHNTWANQRRKRREAAGKLRTSKQLSTNHTSDVSVENCQTGNEMGKNPKIGAVSEFDSEEMIESGQKYISTTVNETIRNEHLPAKLPSILTNESSNSELSLVQDSSDVIGQNSPDTGELMTNATINHVATPESKAQNDETPCSDNKDMKLQANTQDNISLFHTADKKRKEPTSPNITKHKPKFFKSDDSCKNEQLFLEFVLTLGARHTDTATYNLPQMFLQMEWINGQDRNCMYQLFQYFQNRFNS